MIRFLFTLFFLMLPAQAFALAGDWVGDDVASVRLISGVTAVGSDAAVPLGLEVKLARGWHTYWRSPGSTGLPPQLDWSRSQTEEGNLQAATLSYPAPRRYVFFGLETIGYQEHIVFPIDATLLKAGKALKAEAGIDLLLCRSICIPKHYDLALALPIGGADPSPNAESLNAAKEKLPSDPEDAGILLKSVISDGESLIFTISTREAMAQPDIFIENDKNIGFGAPEVVIEPSGHVATLKVRPIDTLPQDVSLAKLPLTLTIVNGDRATEIKAVTSSATIAPDVFIPPKVEFKLALLFALLGGFILNLMPCVLPVLSLKIVSVVSHGGGDKGRVRQSFLVTAAGITFSFLLLASVMIAL
ncbi:MAG: protein-disulfide reductase DsbD domain-containing protein, partial [Bdellovibrionales bacterium]